MTSEPASATGDMAAEVEATPVVEEAHLVEDAVMFDRAIGSVQVAVPMCSHQRRSVSNVVLQNRPVLVVAALAATVAAAVAAAEAEVCASPGAMVVATEVNPAGLGTARIN